MILFSWCMVKVFYINPVIKFSIFLLLYKTWRIHVMFLLTDMLLHAQLPFYCGPSLCNICKVND